jgi:hypothetical protein
MAKAVHIESPDNGVADIDHKRLRGRPAQHVRCLTLRQQKLGQQDPKKDKESHAL